MYSVDKVINEQRAVADKALSMVYTIDPFAIVAGGAPRDWYLRRVATDIDLFFSVRDGVQIGIVHKILEKAGFSIFRVKTGEGLPEWYKINPKIKAVFESNIDGICVQIILVDKKTFDVVDEFPLSICKTWYKNGRIVLEQDFIRSIKRKVIYKTNNLYANGHVYLKKILAKFPDYRYYDSLEKLALDVLDNYEQENSQK
jgi:hypothetical protein